jgi:hypothetical protein
LLPAYRDRWHITGERVLGASIDVTGIEQRDQRRRAHAAAERARALVVPIGPQQFESGVDIPITVERGIEW